MESSSIRNCDRTAVFKRILCSASLLCGFPGLSGHLAAAEPLAPTQLSKVTQQFAAARIEAGQTSGIAPRIRQATWELLVGEMAGHRAFGLTSRAFDALSGGLKDLDRLQIELKAQPELERELTRQPQLAMRMDAMQARRVSIEKQRDISRADELERLSQLRAINRSYRELVRNLLRLQTSQQLGNAEEMTTLGDESTRLMSQVEDVVGQRRDFYLFDDEPDLTPKRAGELQLVLGLAEPMARDVRRYQLALQAYALARLAMPISDSTRGRLEVAKRLAEKAIEGENDAPVLAYCALAIVGRDSGLLETTDATWDLAAHERALPWFEFARENLAIVQSRASGDGANPAWVAEVNPILTELTSPDEAIVEATTLLEQGRGHEAVVVMERCATLHRTTRVAVLAIDCRRLAGASLEETDRLVAEVWKAGLLSEDNPADRLVRARQAVPGLWRELSADRLGQRGDDWRQRFSERLKSACADLAAAAKSDDVRTRQSANCYLAFANAIQLSIAADASPDDARVQLSNVPLAIREIEELLEHAPTEERMNARQAVMVGYLAQGYLAMRLLPDYRDTGPRALARATDLLAQVPAGLTMPRPLGGLVWQSLSARPDGADARLAGEEQLIRRSLERALPAVSAMTLAPTVAAAAALSRAARELAAPAETWKTWTAIDPRETGDARTTAGSEIRTATILAFLAAREPAEALREALFPWRQDLTSKDLIELDLPALGKFLTAEIDPVRKSVVALAMEEFATSILPATATSSRDMLVLALEMQQSARRQFDDSSVLSKTHPAQLEMNRQALQRLTEPDVYLTQSRDLISDLRLSDARKLLTAGSRRHPDSMALREALVQTLIDEANLRPERADALIASAIEQLKVMTAGDGQGTTESCLKLAGLYERSRSDDLAQSLYRKVADQAGDARQRLLARSRLAVLQIGPANR
jgi:hypothetical protein